MTFQIADLFDGCRMVLSLQCGDGALLRTLPPGTGGVGLDTELAMVEQCRAAALPAYAGSWRVLGAHRRKFDAVHVPSARLRDDLADDATGVLTVLAESLLDGGWLVVEGEAQVLRALRAQLPDLLTCRALERGVLVASRRTAQIPSEIEPVGGAVVGPLADLFVGCVDVVDFGCGQPGFLEALQVRDVRACGLEFTDPMQKVFVVQGDRWTVEVDGLTWGVTSCDGVFLGEPRDGLDDATMAALVGRAQQVLQEGGRLVVRADGASRDPQQLEALCRRAGFQSVRSAPVPRDPRSFLVIATADAAPWPIPDKLPAPRIASAGKGAEARVRSFDDLERSERRHGSPSGEDGVIDAIFRMIGTTNCCCVDLGCGDGTCCNTAWLRVARGWRALLIDAAARPPAVDAGGQGHLDEDGPPAVHREWVTAENVDALMVRHDVPDEPDLVSLDLGGNDYHVWAGLRYRPRVVIVGYNANLAPEQSLATAYDPEFRPNGTDHYGASLLALSKLGRSKGYTLVYCTTSGRNAFFVRDDLVPAGWSRSVASLYRPINHDYCGTRQVPDLSKAMIEV